MAKKKHTSDFKKSAAFLVTLLIFLALFGGIMVWGTMEIWNQGDKHEPTTVATEPVSSSPAAYRLLLITEENNVAEGFVLISALPAQARIEVMPIPRETVVSEGVTECRLFESYAQSGVAKVVEHVSKLTNKPVDHYAVISYANLEKFVAHLGDGVIYLLGEPISYPVGNNTVHMRAGVRTLGTSQVTDILRYNAWQTGRHGEAQAQGDIVAAIINQYFVPGRFDEQDTDFRTAINLVRSDILASQFAAARDDLLALSRHNSLNICKVTFPLGEYIGINDDTRFEMAADALSK